MNLKKILALALCLTLALPLAACGNDPAANSNSANPSQSSSETPNTSPSPSTVPAPAYVNEYTQKVAGIDADTVMFTVDGMDVTAEYYLYWLAYDCYLIDMNYQLLLGMNLDFDEEAPEGGTMADYLKDDARRLATAYLMLEKNAASMGVAVTEAQKAEFDQQKADFIAENGQEALDRRLQQQGISENTFDRLGLRSYLVQNVLDTIPQPSQAEVDAYCEANEIYGAKHILILAAEQKEDGTLALKSSGDPLTNEDGSEFTGTVDEYNAAAKARIEDMLAQIDAADDPIAKFDELMNAYSQDTGLAANPDGYVFTPSTNFVTEFKDAVYELEIDEHSGVVESSFGYHILLRTRPDMAEDYRQDQMAEIMESWADMESTTTAAYDALDVKSFYEKYSEHAQSFIELPEESSAPSASPSGEPSESPSDEPSESPAG